MMVIYPLNMAVLERASWIWDYPGRHRAFEDMLMTVYVSMGVFPDLDREGSDPLPAVH